MYQSKLEFAITVQSTNDQAISKDKDVIEAAKYSGNLKKYQFRWWNYEAAFGWQDRIGYVYLRISYPIE